jgi:hypothetical protein
MRELKPGDCVAFYDGGKRNVGKIICIIDGEYFQLCTTNGLLFTKIHRKQIRLLTPKKERRRIWANFYVGGGSTHYLSEEAARAGADIKLNPYPMQEIAVPFIEVRGKAKK